MNFYQGGFSLLEVLVSLFIVSIGLLGIAGLEIVGLRNTQESYWQSLAIIQLDSFFERLQANFDGASRARECQLWQQDIAKLLPNGNGTCSCAGHGCLATVNWRMQSVHSLTRQAEI